MARIESGGWMVRSSVIDRRGVDRHSKRRRAPHWSEVNNVFAVFRRAPWLRYFMLSSVTLMLGLNFILAPGVPVKVLRADIWPHVVAAGARVDVTYRINRTQVCPNSIESWWATEDGDKRYSLPIRSRTEPKLGKNIPVYLRLAAPEFLGEMCYRSIIRYQCTDGNYTVKTPPLCVFVTP